MQNISYYIAKIIAKLQRPALKNCILAKHVVVLPQTNLINVKIGQYTYVGKGNSMQDVVIGGYCSIGSYVAAGGGTHPMNKLSTSPLFYESHNCFGVQKFVSERHATYSQKLTVIGNDVWIGDMCFIKAGVKIGDGAIIGAHSVVTHDVPPYAIVGGVPARVLRYRFDEETINSLLNSEWWNLADKDLRAFSQYFQNKEITKNNIIEALNNLE